MTYKLLIKTCMMLLLAIILFPGLQVYADYTVTGNLKFEDLQQHISSGFTGNTQERPVRFADILVISNGITIAQGATDINGNFSVIVTAGVSQNVLVVAVTNTVNTPSKNVRVVVSTGGFGNGAAHAYQMFSENGHNPNSDINIGNISALYRNGGDEFNLFDMALDGILYLENVLNQSPPVGVPSTLIIEFTVNPNGTNFAFYNGTSVNLDGALGYDDTILLHEMGHWVQDRFGDFSDNTGGQHFLGDSQQNPRLSFGEAWPTFWGSNVRTHYNLTTGNLIAYNHPSVYMNSNGSINGGQGFAYDLENPGGSEGSGAASEVAVQATMWDMTDGPGTPDFSPGIDDDQENGYFMERPVSETFDFVTTYLAQPPFSGVLTYEDWYDMWVANVVNPQETELNAMQASEHGIRYFEDEFEPNNTMGTATVFTSEMLGNNFRLTTYPHLDEDWFKISGLEGVQYSISTSNMLDGADTYLRVFNAAGSELASNDNVGTVGNPPGALEALASKIQWTAPAFDDYFIQLTRSIFNFNVGGGGVSKYGNFNFSIAITQVPPTYPSLQVSPAVFTIILGPNQTEDRTLEITNGGTQLDLTYHVFEYSTANDTITDFPWLALSPDSGTVPALQTDSVTLSFNSFGFNADTVIIERVLVTSNDLLIPQRLLLLLLRVQGVVGIDDENGQDGLAPRLFVLKQNYPNPFNPSTTISYTVSEPANIILEVFNALGQKVSTLISGQVEAGSHQLQFDGSNLESGVYFYRLGTDEGFSEIRKMLLIK